MTHDADPPLRVLYIVSLFPSLSETFIARELQALRRHGASLAILSLKPLPAPAPDADDGLLALTRYPARPLRCLAAMVRLGASHPVAVAGFVLATCLRMWRQPRNLVRSLAALCHAASQWDWIRGFRPQVIHGAWATYPATVAWFLSRVTGAPYSFTSRAHDIFVEDQMMRGKLATAALAITITRNNQRHLARWMPPGRPRSVHLVHSALDLPRNPFSRQARLPRQLLSVGRLDPIKGYDVLLPALAELRRRGIAFDSMVIGEGALRRQLEAQRDALGLQDVVRFVGARRNDEVRAAMARATLMVMPCVVTPEGNADGIPNVLTEAMAAGLPVVSTRVSGIPELVDDGESGRLVDPGDPLALADAVAALLADPALRERYALAARAKVEREFDVDREAWRLLQHMRQAARVAPGRQPGPALPVPQGRLGTPAE